MTDLFYRAAELRATDLQDNGEIRLICSTDAPVEMGGFREVLVHSANSVDYESARSLLLNHDRDQIIGGVRSIEMVPGAMHAVVSIAESAKTVAGTSIRDLVKSGALRGVSIGYTYDRAGASYDEASQTVTASRWMLREITLTPTPADTRAHVMRSLPAGFGPPISTIDKATISDGLSPAAPAAPQRKAATMADENKPTPQENAPDGAAPKHIEEIAALRQRESDNLRITKLAESHGLRASDFLGKPVDAALESMLEKKAEAEQTAIRGRETVVVQFGASQAEKLNDESSEKLSKGHSVLDVARRHAAAMGLRSQDMNRSDLAAYVLGKDVPGMSKRGSDPANVTSSNFNTVVLANYMDKAVQGGFSAGGANATYPIWTNRRVVADFKTFASGALDTGNLVSTAENLAFPELTKAEHSYTSALGLWGATISLTFQALVNDDLGEFTRMLNRAGQIASRTIDKEVVRVLEAMTWTSNTTTAAALGTAGNLDKVRSAFDRKTGGAGEILGNKPQYLLVPSILRKAALQETTQLMAYPVATNVNTDLKTIINPFLSQAATATQSKYYLIADPALVDTVTVAFLQGAESPMVMEYDAGAVAKRSWKITQAFVAVGATASVGGTQITPGMQQGDGAP